MLQVSPQSALLSLRWACSRRIWTRTRHPGSHHNTGRPSRSLRLSRSLARRPFILSRHLRTSTTAWTRPCAQALRRLLHEGLLIPQSSMGARMTRTSSTCLARWASQVRHSSLEATGPHRRALHSWAMATCTISADMVRRRPTIIETRRQCRLRLGMDKHINDLRPSTSLSPLCSITHRTALMVPDSTLTISPFYPRLLVAHFELACALLGRTGLFVVRFTTLIQYYTRVIVACMSIALPCLTVAILSHPSSHSLSV